MFRPESMDVLLVSLLGVVELQSDIFQKDNQNTLCFAVEAARSHNSKLSVHQ